MRSHPTSTLPNNPNYYWAMALSAYDKYEHSGFYNTHKRDELMMYLFLYEMSTTGEI